MIKNFPAVYTVKFKENNYGGWYAVFFDRNGAYLGDKYYLSMPRWWFKVVAKRALRRVMIFDGASVTRDDVAEEA